MAVYHQVVAVAVALIVVGIGSVNPAYAGEFTGTCCLDIQRPRFAVGCIGLQCGKEERTTVKSLSHTHTNLQAMMLVS